MKLLIILLIITATNAYIYKYPKYFLRSKRSYLEGAAGHYGGGIDGHYGYGLNTLPQVINTAPPTQGFRISLEDLRTILALPSSTTTTTTTTTTTEAPTTTTTAEPEPAPAPEQPPPINGTTTVQLPVFIPLNLSAMLSSNSLLPQFSVFQGGALGVPGAGTLPSVITPAAEIPAAPPNGVAADTPATKPDESNVSNTASSVSSSPPITPEKEIIKNIIYEVKRPFPIEIPVSKPIYISRPPVTRYYTIRGPIYKGGWRR